MSMREQEGNHDSVAVANQFILIARQGKGRNICSVSKLMKLVYIAHGYYLALRDKSLIKDEVEARLYGPVIPRIWNTFKRRPPTSEPLETVPGVEEQLSPDTVAFIRMVYDGYGRFSLKQITALTHRKNTPWDLVYHKLGERKKIENELIQQYYRDLLEDDGE